MQPSHDFLPDSIGHAWTSDVAQRKDFIVVPDGCQDVIVRQRGGEGMTLSVSPLEVDPVCVTAHAGERFVGFRLRPGTKVEKESLVRYWAESRKPVDEVLEDLAHFVVLDSAIEEILLALREVEGGVRRAASVLGVSVRTLQRVLVRHKLPPPQFWLQLARVRQAARRVRSHVSLVELALDTGFSDQSHMTREFQRWLSVSPTQLRAGEHALFALLHTPGYG